MRKTGLLFLAFLVLGGAAYFFTKQNTKNQKTTEKWDMDFAYENVDDIKKVFIADRSGKTITLDKKNGYWTVNDTWRARPTAVYNLMSTVKNVRVAYLAPEQANEGMVRSVASQGIKVELYDGKGKNLKTFYIGGVTQDERETYYMMEGSNQPYVVHLPTFVGSLRSRFFVDVEDWRDRAIFYEKPEEIQSISVEYPRSKSESFILEKTEEAKYSVKPFYSTTRVIERPMRKGIAESYILQYESLVAEAFENDHPERDSISQLIPFAIVSVKKTDGTEKTVRFIPSEIVKKPATGEQIVIRELADCSWGDFMLIQDLVFNPIFRGYSYFFENEGNRSRIQ